MLNVLVIGFGKMGMLHTSIVNTVGNIKSITIVETNSIVRKYLKNVCPHFIVVKDYNSIDLKKIDCAIISTPTYSHYDIIKDLINYNINLFVEKPLVSQYDQIQDLLSFRIEDKIIMVGNCFRFSDSFELAQNIIKKEKNTILNFEASFYSSDVLKQNNGWRYKNVNLGQGVILDLGIHVIDIVRHIFGDPIIIKSSLKSIYSNDIDDEFNCILKYENFNGKISCSWSVPGIRKPDLAIKIVCIDKKIIIDEEQITFFTKDNKVISKHYSNHMKKSVEYDLAGSMYTKQFLEFQNAILNNGSYRNNIFEAEKNHKIINEIINKSK